MITPKDIREMKFEKSVFSGYDMGPVDDYLDQIANDIEQLQKELASTKAKMKVLVDKIEEYRGNENAVNAAILSAQKLSVQIESDARTRAASIISEAEKKAATMLGSIDERIALEETRLQTAKISSAKFFDSVRELLKKQLTGLDAISTATREELPEDGTVRIPVAGKAADRTVKPESTGGDFTQVFKFAAKD